MKRHILLLLLLSINIEVICQVSHSQFPKDTSKRIVNYVNPFIGTADANVKLKNLASVFGGGNTYPGAVMPWGMTSLSPRNTIDSSNKGDFSASPGGYVFGNEFFYGFSQIQLSGVGCTDWGNVLVTPNVGKMTADLNVTKSGYANEAASPGYYKLSLKKYDIDAEASVTTRTTLTKFTCKKASNEMNVVVDLYHAIRGATDGYIKITSNSGMEGWNQNGGFCGSSAKRKVFFVAKFSKAASAFSTFKNNDLFDGVAEQSGASTGGIMQFSMQKGEALLLKIGISFVSIENARLNLETEQPVWDFDLVKSNAAEAWENALSRIKVEGKSERDKTIFYTALYHALIHPSISSDVNGEYITMGANKTKKVTGTQKNQYSVFSLWDTYRNLHPLLTLVYPEVQLDLLKTMVDHSKENGFLPIWELSGDEALIMVGDPTCIVIADSYLKGIKGFDVDAAYSAMIKSSNTPGAAGGRRGLTQYLKHGYIPQDTMVEWVWGSVATSLEYNLADNAIAQLAKALNRPADFDTYLNRSMGYKNFYDPATGFLRAKNENGKWHEPFNADTIRGSIVGADFPCGGVGYTEGNAWQYNFFVPHDIPGLMQLMGKENFVKKLESCFESPYRFVLFNEPDMAYPYLFTYAKGHEYKSQEMVRKSMENYFEANSGGLPGNDDCGTTSSWYIFSAMGFYPANPASTRYQIGSPVFDKVIIHLNNQFYKGKEFVVNAKNNSAKNVYIQSMKLNSKEYSNFYFDHKDIVNGGVWNLNMGAKPKIR